MSWSFLVVLGKRRALCCLSQIMLSKSAVCYYRMGRGKQYTIHHIWYSCQLEKSSSECSDQKVRGYNFVYKFE